MSKPEIISSAAATQSGIAEGTEARVCADIARRQQLGIAKYGQTVEKNPLKLKEWLQHAYEETLDKAVYLRRAIEEIDKQSTATSTASTTTPQEFKVNELIARGYRLTEKFPSGVVRLRRDDGHCVNVDVHGNTLAFHDFLLGDERAALNPHLAAPHQI